MSCMSGALSKDPETGIVSYDEKKMRLLLYVCHELSLRRFKSRHRNPYKSRQM